MALSAGQKQESLTASDVVVIDTAGAVKRTAIDSPPSWATETEPSPQELQLRDQFIRMFHPGRPVLTEIVAASEDENSDIRQLSILALKSLGDLSLLMPMLSRAGDAVTRRARSGRDSLVHGARPRRRQPRARATRGGIRR